MTKPYSSTMWLMFTATIESNCYSKTRYILPYLPSCEINAFLDRYYLVHMRPIELQLDMPDKQLDVSLSLGILYGWLRGMEVIVFMSTKQKRKITHGTQLQ